LRILSQQVKLTEEVGELSEVLLKRSGWHIHDKWEHTKEDIADEIADVIITVAWIARELDISIDEAITNKIQKIEKKWNR
jgi:NTP pyrophosphatase (non-canonical NTP hydrolase)